MTSTRPDVLVVGAGVSGLTTGVRLAERGLRVRFRAERAPARTSSAAAGAIWDPIYAEHPRVEAWAARSYQVFAEMAGAGVPGVRLVAGVEASRKPMASPDWALDLPGYRECAPDELRPGFVHGWHYTAPIIDMPPYLAHLAARAEAAGAEAAYGVRVRSIDEVRDTARVVINCTGIGARELVPDPSVQPIRGQLVAVRNPGMTEFFAEHTETLGEMIYLLPQGDVLLLGGSAEEGVADPEPDMAVAAAILDRCSEIFPELATAEVLGHRAGIRPARPQIRLEAEGNVIHNYGHSGAGVSVSWGCAEDVTSLVLGLLE